ncbi:TlpA disulfide reductase family protein [Mucilaginibacter rubeus]|uniref:AhpC/TSA family protein n=1 Tax=Mucilaginibacter rubeus TaxID=2027860 RepID=A0A5C1I1S7_9SPHI|nr:TlpA disulfide reductase family protein [Mucilaginibacter rubeus]QEM11756.1 AhpC/TSA family protein [Mucilaginibacter rubeus]
MKDRSFINSSLRLLFCLPLLLITLQQSSAKPPGNRFVLKGMLSANRDSAILTYIDKDGKYTCAVTPVIKGAFQLEGRIALPEMASILFKNKNEHIPQALLENHSRRFYLEASPMMINGDPGRAAELKITGSQTETEYEILEARTRPIREEMKPLVEAYRKEGDHEKAALIEEKFTSFNDRIKKLTYAFFLEYPNSWVTLDQMRFYVSQVKIDSAERIYRNMSKEQSSSSLGVMIAEEIQQMKQGLPGNMAAPFTKTELSGHPLSLSDFKGKYVLLDFWASWCVPCRKGNPHLLELYRKYGKKGLVIIGIADDDRTLGAWRSAVEKDQIGVWHQILRGYAPKTGNTYKTNPDDLDYAYGVHDIPTQILIDPNGRIAGRFGDNQGGTQQDMDQMLMSVFEKLP